MSFLPKENIAGILVGIYLVNAALGTLPIYCNVSYPPRLCVPYEHNLNYLTP